MRECSVAVNVLGFAGGSESLNSSASSDHHSTGTNAAISRSRSTIIRRATDCTRPADSPNCTFSHSSGLISYPTSRSSMRRACCAFTSSMSISRGCSNASSTACLVISWNTTRLGGLGFLSQPAAACRCQEMASPSRSGSVARNMSDALAPASLRPFTRSRLSFMVRYLGANSSSVFTPSVDFGRSRTCPMDAATTYLLPRIWPTVRALAGDSTITSRLPAADGTPDRPRVAAALALPPERAEFLALLDLADVFPVVLLLVPVLGGIG